MKLRTKRTSLSKAIQFSLPLIALFPGGQVLAQNTDSIRLEVEDFINFSDTTAGNSGNAYRTNPGDCLLYTSPSPRD